MAPEKDLKAVLSRLEYPDDAKVVQQLAEHTTAVRSRMDRIRRKLVVLSGKGGVGKSVVTTNLALAFARHGLSVGLLDVDLNGPCVPKMLGMKGQRFVVTPEGAIPPAGPLGIKVASMEFFLERDAPVRWKGPMDLSPVWLGIMEMQVIRELLADIVWGDLDLLLADLPPGAAADKPPAIAGFIPELDGAIVVSTPSEVAADVVRKSIAYTRDVGIRVIGLVENMAGYVCPQCRHEGELFEEGARGLAEELGIPLLGRVPFDQRLARASGNGTPLMDADDPIVQRFDQIAVRIAELARVKSS